MKNKVGLTLSDPKEKEWIVFAHYRDLLGQIVYKFLGEFHLSLEESDNSQYIFNRKKSKIYFDNLQVINDVSNKLIEVIYGY